MNHRKNAGFAALAVIAGVIAVVILAGAGWYFTRQPDVPIPMPDVVEGTGITPTEDEGPRQLVVQSHRSFTLKSDVSSKNFQPKQPTSYSFSVVDDQGTTVKEFATVHEKIMHVIIVRKDLQAFQHVHPDFDKTAGQFTIPNLTFPSDGPYRIFADFTPMSAQRGPDGMPLGVTLHEDMNVGNLANYKARPVTDSPLTKTFQNYQVTLTPAPMPVTAEQSTTLTFAINQAGKPVTNVEKYLGALGHTVALREGDLEFLHTHALDEDAAHQTGKIDFAVTFPAPGKYKAFSQFQHQGNILTTEFVVTAENKAAGTNQESPAAAPGHNAPTH